MKSLEELHKQYNIYEDKKFIYLNYQFDNKTQDWKFVGYKCSMCGKLFKKHYAINTHEESCRPIRPDLKKDRIEGEIVDVKGNKWKPIDFNQN